MNTNLYVVQHEVDGECYVSPVIGDDELRIHIEMAENFGARLVSITDVERELHRFVWDCCFEGMMNRWLNGPE